MQKLSGSSLDKFNKSCRVFHQESYKIGFVFFSNFLRFSTHFTRINKVTLPFKKPNYTGSLDSLSFHRYAPNSQKPPWKELVACNVVLGTEGGAAGRNSGESATLSIGEGAEGD
jgi:hypothetical protein